MDYRIITHDCQSFLCQLIKVVKAQIHSSSINEFWDYSLLRKNPVFRVLEALSEIEKKYPTMGLTLYPSYPKISLLITNAKNRNNLNEIIAQEAYKNIPIIENKITHSMNIHE